MYNHLHHQMHQMEVCGRGKNGFKEGALVLMQQKLTQIIKQIAVDAIETKKPLDVVIGNIISVEPLKINLSQFVNLESESIIVPLEFIEHEEEIIIQEQKINILDENEEEKEYTIKEQTIKIKTKTKLKDNDQVVLLKFDKGQKFFLLGVQRF